MPAALAAAPKSGCATLAELAGSGPILSPLLIVVAHPDDETIAIGGQMWRLRDALLLHVTDGAPSDGEDARRHGFVRLADYRTARRDELAAALIAGEATGVRTTALGVPDKEAFLDLAGLARQLAGLLRRERPVAVLTHAYEGGHPDHDAAAFAVHAACRCLAAEDRPAIIEMPFYHAVDGHLIASTFLPGDTKEVTFPLGEAELRRKRQMVECFHTQREMLCRLELSPERFRLAPAYNFREPPHSGTLLYETFGWGIAGADWRGRAGDALDVLGLVYP
jgi:LmbE family N-acetylglucosaminyl deacetylase